MLTAVAAMVLGLSPTAVQAAPKPVKPVKLTTITVAGPGAEDLTIQQAERDDIFQLLLSEVSWLANATPQASAAQAKKLGPKYVLTVLAKDKPQQVYELYPLATGGPRAHRPAKQPTGKKTDGWYFGRFTMSESLRVSGVPLKVKNDVVNGGIGAGLPDESADDEVDAVAGVNGYLGQIRRLFLLNGAVLVLILFGLAGIAFLIRRRV